MKPDDDITNFWLAWRELCSIRLCMDAKKVRSGCKDPDVSGDAENVASDARAVVETTNKYFAKMIKSPRKVQALKRFAETQDEVPPGCNEQGLDDALEERAKVEVPLPSAQDARSDSGAHFADGPNLGTINENPDNAVPSYAEPIHAAKPTLKRGKMVSEYLDLVSSWYEHDLSAISAFELVEIDLYREAAVKSGEAGTAASAEPMLNGKKLKDYLFEDIGGRDGGLCRNLWGYLLKENPSPCGLSRLRMVANASFRNPLVEAPPSRGDGEREAERPDPSSIVADESIPVNDAGNAFRKYLSARWTGEFDVTDRIVLCCAFFEYVLSDPFVESLVQIGKSALNSRKTKRVSEVFAHLKDAGCSFDDVRALFCGLGQKILAGFATGDPACKRLIEHFEEKKGSGGTEMAIA